MDWTTGVYCCLDIYRASKMKLVEINGVKVNLDIFLTFVKCNVGDTPYEIRGFIMDGIPPYYFSFDSQEARDKFWDEELRVFDFDFRVSTLNKLHDIDENLDYIIDKINGRLEP